MTQFFYKAKQGPQKIVEGVVDADNLDAAIRKLVQSGYSPLDVSEQDKTPSAHYDARTFFKKYLNFSQRVPYSEVTIFTRQVSDLIDAGVPILRAIDSVRKQIRHPYFNSILVEVCSAVKDGEMFSEALARFPQVFPAVYINLVKSGEVGGNMSLVLRRLADFTEAEQEARAQIQASLIYPSLILAVGGMTIFILLTWVIPRLTAIFEDLSESLPLPTRILLGLSDFFAHFWWAIVLLICGIILFLERLLNTPAGRLWWDGFKLKVPILGNFLQAAEIGRFSRTLGTLLDNGVPIVAALESVALVIENEVLKQAVKEISQKVSGGKSLTEAVEECVFFPETAVQMIAVGEETGHPGKGLHKLAGYYERQVQRFMKAMTSLIEPGLILILGAVVGFVVLAMLMPIFRMNLIVR